MIIPKNTWRIYGDGRNIVIRIVLGHNLIPSSVSIA